MALSRGDFGRRVLRAAARVYYSPIQFDDAERIRQAGPLLLVANHPNSLLDPVIVGIAARRPVRFLAKEPLFRIPFLGRLMRAHGMIPAYRAIDNEGSDRAQVSRNIASLSAGAEALARGEALGIFPEGKSHDEIRVEPVKSGAARIAIQAVQTEGGSTLQVVPVGINYERKERFRSAVWVRIGEPIDVQACLDQHAGDERKARRALTSEIDRRLQAVLIHLDQKEWEPLLDGIETFLGGTETSADLTSALSRRQRIASAINYFHDTDRVRAEVAAAEVTRYREKLDRFGMGAGWLPVLKFDGLSVIGRVLGEFWFLSVGFMVAIIGTLYHLVPFVLVRSVATRLQAPGRTTVSLTRLGLGLPVYGAWYVLCGWALTRYSLPWVAWVWLALMPFAGVFALSYWPRAWAVAQLWWREVALLANRRALAEIRREQHRVEALLAEFAAEYEARSARPSL